MNKNRNMSMCCEKGENMKKNIKKLLTGSIACILAVCITGCGGSGSGGKAIEIPASFKTAEAEAKEEESKFITFDPILLLDEADLQIYLAGVKKREDGWNLRVYTVNGTDRSISFNADVVTINGLDIDAFLYTKNAPGEVLEDDIYADEDGGFLYGFTALEDLGIQFRMMDSDTEEIYLLPDPVHVKLPGAVNTVQYVPEGEVIYDSEGMTAILENTLYEYSDTYSAADDHANVFLRYYISNDTDKEIYFDTGEISLNGIPTGMAARRIMMPGHKTVYTIPFKVSDLKEAGIGRIENVTQSVTISTIHDVYDMNEDWVVADETGEITVSVEQIESVLSERQTIADQEGITCTIESIRRGKEENSCMVTYTAENHTDKECYISLSDIYINGRKIEDKRCSIDTRIAAGETAEQSFSFPLMDLENHDIRNLQTLTARAKSIDFETPMLEENYHYSPFTTITLSDSGTGTAQPPEGIVLLEENGVRYTLLAYGMGGAVEVLGTGDYPLLKLCVENNSGRDLLIRNTDKTYVNGEKRNDQWDYGSFRLAVPDGCAGIAAFEIRNEMEDFDINELRFRLETVDLSNNSTIGKTTPIKLIFQ